MLSASVIITAVSNACALIYIWLLSFLREDTLKIPAYSQARLGGFAIACYGGDGARSLSDVRKCNEGEEIVFYDLCEIL